MPRGRSRSRAIRKSRHRRRELSLRDLYHCVLDVQRWALSVCFCSELHASAFCLLFSSVATAARESFRSVGDQMNGQLRARDGMSLRGLKPFAHAAQRFAPLPWFKFAAAPDATSPYSWQAPRATGSASDAARRGGLPDRQLTGHVSPRVPRLAPPLAAESVRPSAV